MILRQPYVRLERRAIREASSSVFLRNRSRNDIEVARVAGLLRTLTSNTAFGARERVHDMPSRPTSRLQSMILSSPEGAARISKRQTTGGVSSAAEETEALRITRTKVRDFSCHRSDFTGPVIV